MASYAVFLRCSLPRAHVPASLVADAVQAAPRPAYIYRIVSEAANPLRSASLTGHGLHVAFNC